MTVLFLDFDGVLNNQGSFVLEGRRNNALPEGEKHKRVQETLDPVNCSNVQFFLDQYKDMKIVLSTAWRLHYPVDWLKTKLAEYGVDSERVIGKTPWHSSMGLRGNEIQDWLDQHPDVTRYIVFDDNDDRISQMHPKNFIKTSWNTGFTFEHTLKAMKIMKELKNAERVKKREEKADAKTEKP